eukprot:jgi/Ulvmu1/10990/UM007_0170.1
MESGEAECKLLVGPAAMVAQVLLFAIVILGLLYKRSKEIPPRPLLTWGMDVSKQLVSSAVAHIMGMLIAILAQLRATQQVTSECSWYFVTFSVDTTLGVVLVLTMHNACVRIAKGQVQKRASSCQSEWSTSDEEEMADDMEKHLTGLRLLTTTRYDSLWIYESIADCGDYGTPPNAMRWAVQLAQFTACVIAARILCGAAVITSSPLLAHVAASLDTAFRGHPSLLLYFVMVACPVLMNTGQAWVQDQFLKWGSWDQAGSGGGGVAAGPLRGREDRGAHWAELGHLRPQLTQSPTGDLEGAPGRVPGKRGPGGAGQSPDKAVRAAVALRQKAAAAAVGSERRVRPPLI